MAEEKASVNEILHFSVEKEDISRYFPLFSAKNESGKGGIPMEKKKNDHQDDPKFPPLGGWWNALGPAFGDPQGWYTGVPEDIYEEPVQDADDL